MAAAVFACLLAIQLCGTLSLTSAADIQPEAIGVESRETPFTDDKDLYRQYDLLKRVVKRQTKGSCTCTCETRPVSFGDSKASHHTTSGNDSRVYDEKTPQKDATHILRTGFGGLANALSSKYGRPDGQSAARQYDRGPLTGSLVLTPQVVPSHDEGPEDEGSLGAWRGGGMESEGGRGDESWEGEDEFESRPEDVPSSENRIAEGSWGHRSRFPWKLLPDRMCYRDTCSSDQDCCLRFNHCDRSARICTDCWYGSSCHTEQQCCLKYPYCHHDDTTEAEEGGGPAMGKCVDSI